MGSDTAARSGARKVIDTCLGLAEGQELLILCDETTTGVADVLLEVAGEIGVHASALYVPVAIQVRLGEGAELPLVAVGAIREAMGILTCVTDAQECLPFRSKVFDISLDRRTRIGHMPGVTLDILPMADVDYQRIRADCELLAAALLKGKRLDLITRDGQGQEHRLTVGLGGWARPPTISNGLIERGGWANIPPGETFVAPLEGTGNGSVIVNGSLPGYVIPPGGEAWLDFEEGRLVEYGSSDARCREILAGLRDFSLGRGDRNWNNLAEVGLGVNPAVEPLTGIELLDEKKYGTAHIALGENEWFGGTVSSAIHSDLIMVGPTVQIDERTILEGGQIRTTWADWQEDHRLLTVDPAWRASFSGLSRSGTRGERSVGLLKREWISGRGDTHYLQVGTDASARKAAYLYAQIPPFDGWIEIASLLAHNPELDETEVYQLISLMQAYELVELT